MSGCGPIGRFEPLPRSIEILQWLREAFNLSAIKLLAGNLDSLLLKTFTEPYRLQFHLSFQLENTHAQTDFCLALATASLPRLGHTQVTLEMTQVTCANNLAMLPDETRMFSAWMSDWFNQKLASYNSFRRPSWHTIA